MTEAQIESTINMILSDVAAKSMTFEDYKVCFENAKKGYYGKAFDRLDGQVIFEWINAYFAEKSTIIQEKNNLLHDKSKRSEPLDMNIEGVRKVVEVLKQAIKPIPNVEVSKSNAEIKTRQFDQKHALIQRLFRRFEQIYFNEPYETNNGRFIKRYGKIMGQVEYIEHKLKQYERIKPRLK